MSLTTDLIAEFQRKTGESVLESKRYLDLANGNLNQALEIYLEEKTTGRPAARPTYQQRPAQQASQYQKQPSPSQDENNFDMETMAKEKAAENAYKLLRVSSIISLVLGVVFVAIPIVMFIIMGPQVPTFVGGGFILVMCGVLVWTGIVSLQRANNIIRIAQDCNVPKHVAVQALTLNKWRLEPSEEMIRNNQNNQ